MALETLFEMFRGDDYSLQLTFTDQNSAIVDITGWVFKSTIKISPAMLDDAATVTVDIPAVSGMSAEAGKLYINFPSEQTANLLPGENYVDIQREYNGIVSTLWSGLCVIHSDVTRRVG